MPETLDIISPIVRAKWRELNKTVDNSKTFEILHTPKKNLSMLYVRRPTSSPELFEILVK